MEVPVLTKRLHKSNSGALKIRKGMDLPVTILIIALCAVLVFVLFNMMNKGAGSITTKATTANTKLDNTNLDTTVTP